LKITLESTDRLVRITGRDCPTDCEVPGRVWEGTTESGIPVVCVITRIATDSPDQTQFQKELQECEAPTKRADVFPLRMII
jgi:hypothetical protein